MLTNHVLLKVKKHQHPEFSYTQSLHAMIGAKACRRLARIKQVNPEIIYCILYVLMMIFPERPLSYYGAEILEDSGTDF
jgi:hypothetical protein